MDLVLYVILRHTHSLSPSFIFSISWLLFPAEKVTAGQSECQGQSCVGLCCASAGIYQPLVLQDNVLGLPPAFVLMLLCYLEDLPQLPGSFLQPSFSPLWKFFLRCVLCSGVLLSAQAHRFSESK